MMIALIAQINIFFKFTPFRASNDHTNHSQAKESRMIKIILEILILCEITKKKDMMKILSLFFIDGSLNNK